LHDDIGELGRTFGCFGREELERKLAGRGFD
jgi:hypothetical protein